MKAFARKKLISYPVAVCNVSNEPALRAIEPCSFKAMVAEFAEKDMNKVVISRIEEKARAIEVDIDEV